MKGTDNSSAKVKRRNVLNDNAFFNGANLLVNIKREAIDRKLVTQENSAARSERWEQCESDLALFLRSDLRIFYKKLIHPVSKPSQTLTFAQFVFSSGFRAQSQQKNAKR
jgi:hypothetical protein